MVCSNRGSSAFLEPFTSTVTRPRLGARTLLSYRSPGDSTSRRQLESAHNSPSGSCWHNGGQFSPARSQISRRLRRFNTPTPVRIAQRGFATTQSVGWSSPTQPLKAPAESALPAGDDAYIPFESASATAFPARDGRHQKNGADFANGTDASPTPLWPRQVPAHSSAWPLRPLEGQKLWKELESGTQDGSEKFEADVELTQGLGSTQLNPEERMEKSLKRVDGLEGASVALDRNHGELSAVSNAGRISKHFEVKDEIDKGTNTTGSVQSLASGNKKQTEDHAKMMTARGAHGLSAEGAPYAKPMAHKETRRNARASSATKSVHDLSRKKKGEKENRPDLAFHREARSARRKEYLNDNGANTENRIRSRTPRQTRFTSSSIKKSTTRPTNTYITQSPKPLQEQETWRVRKAALQQKFKNSPWNPPKRLSPDAMEGVRALNDQYPDHFTIPDLAAQFKMSPEAIRRILKNRWKPKTVEEEEDRSRRWDRRGERIWTDLVDQGVHPPKKWRMMGIGGGPRRKTQDRTFKKRAGSSSSLGHQETEVDAGSGWLNALSERL